MVALYVLYRDGVPDEDRRRLYQHARLGMTDQDAINSLSHLGVRITRVGYLVMNPTSIVLLIKFYNAGTHGQGHKEEAQTEAISRRRI